MRHLVVLLDDADDFANFNYFLSLLINCWRQQNWHVSFSSDWRQLPDADLALLHVNRTVVPEYIIEECRRRYSRVINGATGNISKRQVSRHLMSADTSYSGPVIVKTDANCGGRRERYNRSYYGKAVKLMDRVLPWTQAARLSRGQYPIYPNISTVPQEIWDNRQLVVERLCCERENDLYALRQWVFFGDQELNKISWAREPIVKANNVVKSAMLEGVPELLRERRKELGFDYGKFDYVMFEGHPILLDANRTPTYGKTIGQAVMQYATRLAKGIEAFHD